MHYHYYHNVITKLTNLKFRKNVSFLSLVINEFPRRKEMREKFATFVGKEH